MPKLHRFYNDHTIQLEEFQFVPPDGTASALQTAIKEHKELFQ